MRITIEKNEQAFDLAAAKRIVQQIKEKPESVIGLSTGRTTRNMHRLVAQIHHDQPFDATRATFFGIDEVTGVSRSYSGACYTMLKTEIIDDLGVDEDHFLMLPTATDNLDADCKHFSDELQHKGGIDLLILGLGENGHLGFNQPGTSFESTAGTGSMDSALENRIRRETGVPAEHPLGGVTLGLSDIMQARRILLVAKGTSKAEIVKKVLHGPVDTHVPASILQRHPHCEVLLDADAASCLSLAEKKSGGDKPSHLAPFLMMVFIFLVMGFLATIDSQLQRPLQSAFLARVGLLRNTLPTMVIFSWFLAYPVCSGLGTR